jgi:hypothetical protein
MLLGDRTAGSLKGAMSMSFDDRDIRRSMDVYTLDNAYLGTVLSIRPGPVRAPAPRSPAARQSSGVSGELLGPMPTQPIGNLSPLKQSASAGYGTAEDAIPIGAGELVIGSWWGLVGRRVIPLADVQTVSLERVVLKWRKAELG